MEGIERYFEYYKIKLENHSNAIGYFNHPLHLKIFCETKNHKRTEEVKVSFQNEDLFDVFDEYIKISNNNITASLKELDAKYNNDFTEKNYYSFLNIYGNIVLEECLALKNSLKIMS